MKLGVIAAAAMLFAAVLRRMTEKPQNVTVRGSLSDDDRVAPQTQSRSFSSPL
jgi:hypothetical protein